MIIWYQVLTVEGSPHIQALETISLTLTKQLPLATFHAVLGPYSLFGFNISMHKLKPP